MTVKKFISGNTPVLCLIGILVLLTEVLNLSAKSYSVLEFGAKADGVNIDTRAVQEAIDTCANGFG
jgi:hypothetical protein